MALVKGGKPPVVPYLVKSTNGTSGKFWMPWPRSPKTSAKRGLNCIIYCRLGMRIRRRHWFLANGREEKDLLHGIHRNLHAFHVLHIQRYQFTTSNQTIFCYSLGDVARRTSLRCTK